MRRIVVSQFVSLDGVIEDPVGIESLGRGAWSSSTDSGPEGAKLKVDEMMQGARSASSSSTPGRSAPASRS